MSHCWKFYLYSHGEIISFCHLKFFNCLIVVSPNHFLDQVFLLFDMMFFNRYLYTFTCHFHISFWIAGTIPAISSHLFVCVNRNWDWNVLNLMLFVLQHFHEMTHVVLLSPMEKCTIPLFKKVIQLILINEIMILSFKIASGFKAAIHAKWVLRRPWGSFFLKKTFRIRTIHVFIISIGFKHNFSISWVFFSSFMG